MLGRAFPYSLLAAIAGQPEETLQNELDKLIASGLVFSDATSGDVIYTFKHALVQEAAYSSLLKSRRRELHRAVSVALNEKFSETAKQRPELVAHHLTEAGDSEKAVEAWQTAGDFASARAALVEAGQHYNKALAVLQTMPDSPDRAQLELPLQISWGHILGAIKGFGSEEEKLVYLRAREIAHPQRRLLHRGARLLERLHQPGDAEVEAAFLVALRQRAHGRRVGQRDPAQQLPVRRAPDRARRIARRLAYYAAVTKPENKGFENGVNFFGRNFVNTELKDYVLAFGFLIIAAASPILSSIADYKGNRKNFMRFFCYLGAVSCSLVFFFDKSSVTFGLFCFMFAGIGFYGSQLFYNSYLPDIVAEADRDRISAKGYSFGYIGSVLMQMIGFALVMLMEDKGKALQITFLLVGIWWIAFAQIPFKWLPMSSKPERSSRKHVIVNGFHELKLVWRQLVHMPVLKRFLSAFFFYSMGVETVMLVAIDFGIKELKLADDKLIITAVIIQLVAIAGAIGMSRLSEKFGNIRVLLFTVLLWIGVCITGYFITTEIHFYILAALVGLVMGGIQSLSRSTYSKLMPETKDTASFFSFYDITEKLAIVIGLFSFGFIEGLTGSMRNSIVALIVFFILGLLFLLLTSVIYKKNLTTA